MRTDIAGPVLLSIGKTISENKFQMLCIYNVCTIYKICIHDESNLGLLLEHNLSVGFLLPPLGSAGFISALVMITAFGVCAPPAWTNRKVSGAVEAVAESGRY